MLLYLSIRRVHYSMDYSRFEIKKHGSWYVVVIVRLVEKYVFTVRTCGREFLQYPLRRYAMLDAKLLPELKAN